MNRDLIEPEELPLNADAMLAAKAAFEDMEEELLRNGEVQSADRDSEDR